MSLCSEGAHSDTSSSLDSTLHQSMVTASLTEDQAVERQSSVNSFVEGISLSNASPLASSLRFSEPVNILDAQINRMRRSIQTSSQLLKKGKEPVRSFRTDTDCTDGK